MGIQNETASIAAAFSASMASSVPGTAGFAGVGITPSPSNIPEESVAAVTVTSPEESVAGFCAVENDAEFRMERMAKKMEFAAGATAGLVANLDSGWSGPAGFDLEGTVGECRLEDVPSFLATAGFSGGRPRSSSDAKESVVEDAAALSEESAAGFATAGSEGAGSGYLETGRESCIGAFPSVECSRPILGRRG
jgi:hypothetical protein